MIDYQTAVLHVQNFHRTAQTVDEDKYFTFPHITLHTVAHDSGQRVETLTHCGYILLLNGGWQGVLLLYDQWYKTTIHWLELLPIVKLGFRY
jgi:hypothetical protein